jgi:hypothetical protein
MSVIEDADAAGVVSGAAAGGAAGETAGGPDGVGNGWGRTLPPDAQAPVMPERARTTAQLSLLHSCITSHTLSD